MERYSEPTQVIPSTLPQMLKPLLRINYILGTFPYKLSFENRLVTLSPKSFHYYHCLLTLIIILATVFANFLRTLQVLLSPRPVDSQGKPLPIIGKFIEMTCTVYANFITMIILLLLFLKRKVLMKYLTEMVHYSDSLKEYRDNVAVYSMVRKLGSLYTFLAIISGLSVAIRYFNNPGDAPVAIWLEFIGLHAYVSPDIIAVVSSLFVFYLAVVKYACLGNLEVVSCAQSVCFSRSMENIMEYLEAQMQSWRRQFKGLESQRITDKDDFLNLFTSPDHHHFQGSNKFKLQSDLENYIGQIREFNPGLIAIPPTSPSVEATDPTMDTSSSLKKSFSNPSFKTTPGRALCHAARKYLSIASMQNMANSVFGYTLAVNIACTVGMDVILKYLVITNFMGHWKRDHEHQDHDLGPNETLIFGDIDDLTNNITIENSTQLQSSSSFLSFDHLESSQDWLMFLGLDLSMFIRMGVTVICLGRVHKTSLQFNQVMGKAFLTANRIIDEIATVGFMKPSSGGGVGGFIERDTSSNLEDMTKLLMTPTQTSSIIAFINMNNANPVAFTAGGLFVFSRGLILMIVSIIVSYLVFLLQAS